MEAMCGDLKKIRTFTYMVGTTELERKRIDDLLDLQLVLASGPEIVE